MEQNITNIDFSKGNGIVPVIVQDANTKEILTLAYSNKESLERTLSTGNSWFWSRSRKKLWGALGPWAQEKNFGGPGPWALLTLP